MAIPFYINAEVLEKPWGSKHDVLMLILFVIGLLGTVGIFTALTQEDVSFPARLGLSGAYSGMIFGVLFHLGKQTRKGDEFSRKIITQALAQSGMFTILYVVFMTLYQGVFKTGDVGVWAINAPVCFLAFSYICARFLARQYTK